MADPNPPLWFRIVTFPFVLCAYCILVVVDWIIDFVEWVTNDK